MYLPSDRGTEVGTGPPKLVLVAAGIAVVYGALVSFAGLTAVTASTLMGPAWVTADALGSRALLAIGVLLLLAGPNLALGSRSAAVLIAGAGTLGFSLGLAAGWLSLDTGDWLAVLVPGGFVLSCGLAPICVIASHRYFTTWSLPGPWPVAEWALAAGAVAFVFLPGLR